MHEDKVLPTSGSVSQLKIVKQDLRGNTNKHKILDFKGGLTSI